MSKKNVLMTGAAGSVGSVLSDCLKNSFDLTLLDKKRMEHENSIELDVAEEYSRLREIAEGQDALIHLAWKSEENFHTDISLYENKKMIENVYRASLEAGISRTVMASSVHAACAGLDREDGNKLDPKAISPDSPYGATKVWMEALGKYYSTKGLEVLCIRLGGLEAKESEIKNKPEHGRISHRDLCQLFRKCISTENLPEFSIYYGVSNDTFYDISNAEEDLGYRPVDR